MKLDKLTSIRLFKGHNQILQDIADKEGIDRSDIHRRAILEFIASRVNNLAIESK
ncbi:hypothetical protein [Nostoc sp. PA-18-2419]|uniref:hypothetical protein n=1 Tax=Nostoc sp. PA-18-2419 TaxID=2575443 RepID=UPI0016782B3A|nr:hypothetical protein [Nostoc sp. PA-18-2419]